MSQNRTVRLTPANDNQPKQRAIARQVLEEWPEEIPVTCAELDLLELYLRDIILTAANDNAPS